MRFAPTILDEQEVVIRLDRKAGVAHVCSCWPDMMKRIEKRHGSPKETTVDGQGRVTSAFWVLPLDFVASGILRKGRKGIGRGKRPGPRGGRFARKSPT